jgi:hypothetical protein
LALPGIKIRHKGTIEKGRNDADSRRERAGEETRAEHTRRHFEEEEEEEEEEEGTHATPEIASRSAPLGHSSAWTAQHTAQYKT